MKAHTEARIQAHKHTQQHKLTGKARIQAKHTQQQHAYRPSIQARRSTSSQAKHTQQHARIQAHKHTSSQAHAAEAPTHTGTNAYRTSISKHTQQHKLTGKARIQAAQGGVRNKVV